MTAYSPTVWANNVPPPLSAANLNKLTDELEAQASEKSITHSLPTWVDGAAPALTEPEPLNEMERVARAVALAVGLSYTVTAWSSGWSPARNAARFNRLEQQVAANRAAIDDGSGSLIPTVWVAGNGLDTNPGTEAQPWKTLKHACDSTSAGAVIGMAAGTYIETATCAIPNGVSVVGAGIDQTIIRTSVSTSLMTISGGTGATISDLTLDGQSQTTAGFGIYVRNATSLTLTRLKVLGFKNNANYSGSAIDFANVTDFELSNSTLSLSGGMTSDGWYNGCLGIGACTGALIDNCTVTGNGTANGANGNYAVKAGAMGGTLDALEVRNSTFTTTNTDARGSSVCLTFELFMQVYVNCRIHHCNFDGTISLAAPDQNPSIGNPKTNGGIYRMRVDHNYWNIPSASSGDRYCIETSARSLEIDHNYVNPAGLYPFGYFENKQIGYDWIHHNIFDNGHTPRSFSNWDSSYTPTPSIVGIISEKNTVVMRQAFTHVMYFSSGDATNQVLDNIFSSTVGQADILNAGSSTITHNGFYNLTAHGTLPITGGNPSFPFSGGVAGYVPGNSAYSTVGALADGTFEVGPQ